MSRSLPTVAVQELNAAEASSAFLTLVEFSHSLITTVRLVDNTVNITSNSDVYQAFPFQLIMPSDREGVISNGRISVWNATSEIVDELRTVLGDEDRIAVDAHIIRSADPDTYLRSETGLELVNVSYTADTLTGDLSRETLQNEPWPGDRMTPSVTPGLF